MDELTFAEQFVPSGPLTVNDILQRRRLAPDWEEIEAARREREKADAEVERRERMALANRQFGDPLGHLSRAQSAVAEARDRVRHLESQLEDARGVLHRAAEQYVDWSEQAELVTATASRSAPHDLLQGAREQLTDHQLRQMAAQRSQERRPFAHGGHAVRSEPVTCSECIKLGATPEESFVLHSVLGRPLEADEVPDQDKAERRGYGSYAEVVR